VAIGIKKNTMNHISKKICFIIFVLSSIKGYCQIADNNDLIPSKKQHYVISTQKDFENFVNSLNNGKTYANETIDIKKDITADNVTSIKRTFAGVLNGDNHKISNLKSYFIYDLKGEIRNLEIDETCILSGSTYLAPFCIYNNGIVRDCVNRASVTGTAYGENVMYIGGICAVSYGKIIHCINYGSIKATLSGTANVPVRCGGISSYQKGNNVTACNNYGNISASAYLMIMCGGAIGHQEKGSLIGCNNFGSVSSTCIGASSSGSANSSQIDQCTGGIIGCSQEGTMINRCRNYGTISNNSGYVGGVIGTSGNSDLYNLENYGKVESVLGKFYSCAAGITGYSKAYNVKRQFFNCINKGDIISYSQYGIATAAGICPDIVNCYIANLYSSGSTSAHVIGGTANQPFEIHSYEFDDQSTELCKFETIEKANLFISEDKTSKIKLLNWKKADEKVELCGSFYAYAEPTHGSVEIEFFFDDINFTYNVKLQNNETGEKSLYFGNAPFLIRQLLPETSYSYEIVGTNDKTSEIGTFTTLIPNIEAKFVSAGYDTLTVKQNCDVRGVDDIEKKMYVYKDGYEIQDFIVTDSIVVVKELEEGCKYSANVVYNFNGKEYISKKIETNTKAITPQFSLICASHYTLTLKCDNYIELKKYNPCLYVEEPRYYEFGGYRVGENRIYKVDEEGKIVIDSLMYGYAPVMHGMYTFKGQERTRAMESFYTRDFGGEGIIQLSKNAAMVHALFGGMGTGIPNAGYSYIYNRARFYYRDATASDEIMDSYKDGVCIDNNMDYAVTIPIDNIISQYYISLQYNRYTDPKNNSKNGEWQIVNSGDYSVELVEPKFFNFKFVNNNFTCSCVEGEETIRSKNLQYWIEGMENYNDIKLSSKSGSETLSRMMSSIVPQLNYIVRMSCLTTNGNLYYSPMYRLHNGELEMINDNIENKTAINNASENNKDSKYTVSMYSIEGVKRSQPQKGVNIQKLSDGTSRKIVVD